MGERKIMRFFGGCNSSVEHLPYMHRALGSVLSSLILIVLLPRWRKIREIPEAFDVSLRTFSKTSGSSRTRQ